MFWMLKRNVPVCKVHRIASKVGKATVVNLKLEIGLSNIDKISRTLVKSV